jgi:hypothetical protein
MSGLLRVAFVNTSEDTTVTLHLETEDAVECCELLTTTPPTAPEQNPGATHASGGWDLVIAPGTMVGFVTGSPVKISNPSSGAVTTVYANGKDPWPQPPPVSKLSQVPDFPTRYQSFLMVGALPEPRPTPVVMTLAPARD